MNVSSKTIPFILPLGLANLSGGDPAIQATKTWFALKPRHNFLENGNSITVQPPLFQDRTPSKLKKPQVIGRNKKSTEQTPVSQLLKRFEQLSSGRGLEIPQGESFETMFARDMADFPYEVLLCYTMPSVTFSKEGLLIFYKRFLRHPPLPRAKVAALFKRTEIGIKRDEEEISKNALSFLLLTAGNRSRVLKSKIVVYPWIRRTSTPLTASESYT